MTAERRWSCWERRASEFWDARNDVLRQRVAALLPAVSEDDQVALWLAAQVVVRVLGEMREHAGSQARDGADAT